MTNHQVARTRIEPFVDLILGRESDRKRTAVRACSAVVVGTVLACLVSLLYPVLIPGERPPRWHLKSYLPPHSFAEALLVLVSLLLMCVILALPRKWWRSLRLGLVGVPYWAWVLSVAASWISLDAHRPRVAAAILTGAAILTVVVKSIARYSLKTEQSVSPLVDPDLPVPENGEDLLGRRGAIEDLISKILIDRPMLIAVTGSYGEGKTSFLNLTVGELKKIDEADLPIIVRFSPWLAGDSNALVLSLLNSIVAEIKAKYVVPGLSRDAARYARILLSVIPKAERLKGVISEPSQEERIIALADRISKTDRRVLVVVDDLDRTEARELETVLKLLRGSEKLSNFTFLCAFDKTEVAKILSSTRPTQDTATFVEKFFQLQVPLPKVDSSLLQHFFSQRMLGVLHRYGVAGDDESKSLEALWEGGGRLYFQNLRRIKLFLNRINNSLERIADEVNIGDFIRLELIRDITPNVYEEIYLNPEYFYNAELAFEVRYKGAYLLDGEKAAKQRAGFYDKMMASVPADKRYVSQMLEDLFPYFAIYTGKPMSTLTYETDPEKTRRIFHPRCFRQYFLLRVPSELFSEKELKSFVSSMRHLGDDKAAEAFNKAFRALVKDDFKRWHFMERLESVVDELELDGARGLCRGMAQNASIWRSDAFELMIAVRCTRQTLGRMTGTSERLELLRAIIRESTSDLYALNLIWWLEKDASAPLLADLQEIKSYAMEHLRARYLGPDAPSVFEQFGGADPTQNIDPTQFLFAWSQLGRNAEADQRQYLQNLFARRPQNLDEFLKLMFRVRFIDDYTQLKSLIDYRELSQLITRNEAVLNPERVKNFRDRYNAEVPPAE
jgi:hypothetical protein